MALGKCPECGKDVSETASKCPHCGFFTMFCNKCGGEIPRDAKTKTFAEKCPHCGFTGQTWRNKLITIGLILFILWLIFLA